MHRGALAFSIVAVSTSAMACSLLLGGGYSSDRPPLTEDDGGDATIDGGTRQESGSSLADGGDAGPFCAQHASARFCDDFDDPGRPFSQLWAPLTKLGTVTLAKDRG